MTTSKTVCGPIASQTRYIRSVAFSPDGERVVSGSSSLRASDMSTRREKYCFSPKTDSSWNEGSSNLHRGFSLDHSNSWATSTDAVTSSKAPLLIWVPHNRRGSETIIIMETPLNKIDFSRFIHSSSWAQCYLPQAPMRKRTLSLLCLKFYLKHKNLYCG